MNDNGDAIVHMEAFCGFKSWGRATVSSCGRWVAGASKSVVYVVDTRTGQVVFDTTLLDPPLSFMGRGTVDDIVFLAGCKRIAVAHNKSCVSIFGFGDDSCRYIFPCHLSGPMDHMVLAPDARFLVLQYTGHVYSSPVAPPPSTHVFELRNVARVGLQWVLCATLPPSKYWPNKAMAYVFHHLRGSADLFLTGAVEVDGVDCLVSYNTRTWTPTTRPIAVDANVFPGAPKIASAGGIVAMCGMTLLQPEPGFVTVGRNTELCAVAPDGHTVVSFCQSIMEVHKVSDDATAAPRVHSFPDPPKFGMARHIAYSPTNTFLVVVYDDYPNGNNIVVYRTPVPTFRAARPGHRLILRDRLRAEPPMPDNQRATLAAALVAATATHATSCETRAINTIAEVLKWQPLTVSALTRLLGIVGYKRRAVAALLIEHGAEPAAGLADGAWEEGGGTPPDEQLTSLALYRKFGEIVKLSDRVACVYDTEAFSPTPAAYDSLGKLTTLVIGSVEAARTIPAKALPHLRSLSIVGGNFPYVQFAPQDE